MKLFRFNSSHSRRSPLVDMRWPRAGRYRSFRQRQRPEVRVRPVLTEDIAVVFTIRWDWSSGAMFGDLVQDGLPFRYMPLDRSGGVREHGPYNYQVFAGFGMQRMQQAEQPGRRRRIC